MKNLLFTLLLMSALSVNAQTIPNGDFENWCFFGWFYNPCGWNTNNTQITSSFVAPDSDFYSGVLAMQLTQTGPITAKAWNQFACNNHPLTLNGFVKSGIEIEDSALVSVTVFFNGAAVDSGKQYFYSTFGFFWLPFTIPISNSSTACDSVLLYFENGSSVNSQISFDSLYFTFSTGINENTNWSDIQMYFDATLQTLYIQQSAVDDGQLTVLDAKGQLIRKLKKEAQLKSTVSIADWNLAAGIYFVNAENQKCNTTLKILVGCNKF